MVNIVHVGFTAPLAGFKSNLLLHVYCIAELLQKCKWVHNICSFSDSKGMFSATVGWICLRTQLEGPIANWSNQTCDTALSCANRRWNEKKRRKNELRCTSYEREYVHTSTITHQSHDPQGMHLISENTLASFQSEVTVVIKAGCAKTLPLEWYQSFELHQK